MIPSLFQIFLLSFEFEGVRVFFQTSDSMLRINSVGVKLKIMMDDTNRVHKIKAAAVNKEAQYY